jgi:hypothetical protein
MEKQPDSRMCFVCGIDASGCTCLLLHLGKTRYRQIPNEKTSASVQPGGHDRDTA